MSETKLDTIKKHEDETAGIPDPLQQSEDECCDSSPRTKENQVMSYGQTEESTLALFRMVFQAAQEPDEDSKTQQKWMAWVLTGVLVVQVVWALVVIPCIVFSNKIVSSGTLTFASLLVTAILAEVVAMAFVVVRFVFRTPLDTMIDLLKDIVNKK